MSTLKTNNIEHVDASTPSVQMSVGGGVVFPGISTFTGDATFSAGVSIGGTLTYEDVSSIDSVGIITAQAGIRVTGGSVGIGTNNPSSTFVVRGDDLTKAIRFQTNTSTQSSMLFQNSTTGYGSNDGLYFGIDQEEDGYLWHFESENLIFGTSNTERLRITSAGDMGLGTTSPTNFSNYASFTLNGTTGGNIEFKDDNVLRGSIYNLADQFIVQAQGSSTPLSLKTNSLERLRIDSAGKIGVGGAPAAWHSASSSNVIQVGNSVLFDYSAAQFDVGHNYYYDGSNYKFTSTGYAERITFAKSDGSIRFWSLGTGSADANATVSEKLRITSAGFVGIGEDSPDSLLHIGKGTNADDGAVTLTIGGSTVNTRQSTITKNNVGSGDRALEIRAATGGTDETIKFFSDATTERLRIASDGIITTPYQPAFQVSRNQSNWNVASNTKFDWDLVVFNTGSHFSTSTDRFTAPVAGIYHFDFSIIWYAQTVANEWVSIRKNGNRFTGGDIHFSADFSVNRWDNVAYSMTLSLAANDYIEVWNGGNSTINYHGDSWAQFSGHLVG